MKTQRYTNTDLKISVCVCVHTKTVPSKFRIPSPEVCKFLKKQAKQIFYLSHVRISQKVKGVVI